MKKPVYAMLVGAVLGLFDGLSAWMYPEVRPMIAGIVAGSTFKGLVGGLVIGLVAQRTNSVAAVVAVGVAVGAFFAYLVTIGQPYFWEIVAPGMIVGLLTGFAAARYRGPVRSSTA